MKYIAIAARILLGLTFIYSGFVKSIDPWGSTYKFIEYFTAFNMEWMQPLAFVLAIVQNAVEFVIGVTLVLGLRMKETAWGVLLFMGFYTPLTFILALTNPVTDCGCFGDALILTNWQTFYKNIAFMALAIIVFVYRKKYIPAYSPVGEWIWVSTITLMIVGISLHCFRHQPWFDFRPYHIGADIAWGMSVPEGMPLDEYDSKVIMEKDGITKEFPVNDYPWDDTTWVWKDTKTTLIKKGYTPPIHDFSITTSGGFDITEDVLADESYTFLLIAQRLNKSSWKGLDKASEIADFCHEHGYKFYCLTASPQSEIDPLKQKLGLTYDFCFTDEITLKTIIRANPGLVLLQKGTVIGKWHHEDMPDVAQLNPNLLSFSMKQQTTNSKNKLSGLLLVGFLFFAFVFHQFKE